MQDHTGRLLGVYRGWEILFRDAAFYASTEDQNELRADRLGDLLWGIDEFEDSYVRIGRAPRWHRPFEAGFVLVPVDRIDPSESAAWGYDRASGIHVIARDPSRAGLAALYACIPRGQIRVFLSERHCRLFDEIARHRSVREADENYRAFLASGAPLWDPDAHRPRILRPGPDPELWLKCEDLDPDGYSIRTGCYTPSLVFGGFRLEPSSDGLYGSSLHTNMMIHGRTLAGIVSNTIIVPERFTTLWNVMSKAVQEMEGASAHIVPFAVSTEDKWPPTIPRAQGIRPIPRPAWLRESEMIYRMDDPTLCDRPIWFYEHRETVRAFTKVVHLLSWRERRYHTDVREADVSHLLELRFGGDEFPPGF